MSLLQSRFVRKFILFAIVLIEMAPIITWFAHGSEPVTNTIPPNLFLTDNGFLFWYGRLGRVVNISSIKEAEKSVESLPAAQHPQGNWGEPTNGFQLSLRFGKNVFTNGEPIIATILLRNITNKPIEYIRIGSPDYPSPINVLAFNRGRALKLKFGELMDIISASPIEVFPQTQCQFKLNLSHFYNLSTNGDYVFIADYPYGVEIKSKDVLIEIK